MGQITSGECGEPPEWWDFQIKPDWIYDARVHLMTNTNQMKGGTGEKGFYQEVEFYAYDP